MARTKGDMYFTQPFSCLCGKIMVLLTALAPDIWGHLFTRRCRTPPARSMLEEPPREPPVVDLGPLPPR